MLESYLKYLVSSILWLKAKYSDWFLQNSFSKFVLFVMIFGSMLKYFGPSYWKVWQTKVYLLLAILKHFLEHYGYYRIKNWL